MDEWFYYKFAEKFGWTPEQVDNLPAGRATWLLAISGAVEEVKAELAEKN